MGVKLSWPALVADFDMNSVTEVYFWKSEWESYDPHDFSAPVSPYYFLYRFLYMAWFIGSTIHNFACDTGGDKNLYFLYLTNLTFTLQLAYSVVFFLYILHKVFRLRKRTRGEFSPSLKEISISNNVPFHDQKYRLPLCCKFLWILHSTLNIVPYIVSLIYWIVLFPQRNKEDPPCAVAVNVLTHGLNSPMALLETFIVAVPIRRTHVIFPMIAGVGYSTFTGLYEVFGGEYPNGRDFIYPILDWKNKPAVAFGISAAITFVLSSILHFITSYGVYRLRLYLKLRWVKGTASDEFDTKSYGNNGVVNTIFEGENNNYYQ